MAHGACTWGSAGTRHAMDGEAMTTLVISVLLGSWALLFALLAVVPLLPDVPATFRVEDTATSMTCPVASITGSRVAA